MTDSEALEVKAEETSTQKTRSVLFTKRDSTLMTFNPPIVFRLVYDFHIGFSTVYMDVIHHKIQTWSQGPSAYAHISKVEKISRMDSRTTRRKCDVITCWFLCILRLHHCQPTSPRRQAKC